MKQFYKVIALSSLLLFSTCSKESRFAIDTEDPIDVSACRATLKATGKNGGSSKISEKGFCYSAAGIPTINDNPTKSTNGFVDLFEAEVKGLSAKTTYMVRAYTKFSDGSVVLGDVNQFSTTDVYMVGDRGPAGGLVFYTNAASSAAKYYEAFVGTTPSYGWGSCIVNSTSLLEGAGNNNSANIVSSCGSNNAAAYCLDLASNGYSDWYLPSAGELGYLYSCIQANPGIIPAKQYWTSSQYDANQAYSIDLSVSSMWVKSNKTSALPVLAVRSFK